MRGAEQLRVESEVLRLHRWRSHTNAVSCHLYQGHIFNAIVKLVEQGMVTVTPAKKRLTQYGEKKQWR